MMDWKIQVELVEGIFHRKPECRNVMEIVAKLSIVINHWNYLQSYSQKFAMWSCLDQLEVVLCKAKHKFLSLFISSSFPYL